MVTSYLRTDKAGLLLIIRIQPRCSRVGPKGEHNGGLKWGVHAAPVDGAANEELLNSVAEFFFLPRAAVSLKRGEKGREKQILLQGISKETVLSLIAGGAVR